MRIEPEIEHGDIETEIETEIEDGDWDRNCDGD